MSEAAADSPWPTRPKPGRTPLVEAWAWLDAVCQFGPLTAADSVPLAQAVGRVLAEDVTSQAMVPAFRRAMMDGYAVALPDGQSEAGPEDGPFPVVGEVWPGEPAAVDLAPGEACQVMTGAAVPTSAPLVVPVELAEPVAQPALPTPQAIRIKQPIPRGKHIAQPGEDVRDGQTVAQSGRCLRPADVGLLAAVGLAEVAVIARPRVRIIITGDEVRPTGTRLDHPHLILDANGPMLAGLVTRDGGLLVEICLLGDDPKALAAKLREPADVVLVTGGTSAGRRDFVPEVVRSLGDLPIHGLAIRPAGPSGLGRVGSTLVGLLPGNPVACLCSYDLLAGRAIRLLAGRGPAWPYPMEAVTLAADLASQPGRTDYVRVIRSGNEVWPLKGGASALRTVTQADGFILVPAGVAHLEAGTAVTMFAYDPGASLPQA